MANLPSFSAMPDESQASDQTSQQTPQAQPLPSFSAMPDESDSALKFSTMPDETQQFSTPSQTALAGVEGAARGIAGPIAPWFEKHILHVPEQEITGREEANPVIAGAGEAAGLVGGALTGTGEAAVLEGAGNLATEAVGLAKPANYLARVGSAAVKQAAEMAVLSGSDDVSKMVLDDPNTTAETAISNAGLASALGAAGGAAFAGAISPLWNATVGSKVAQGFKALASKLGGIEGQEVITPATKLAEESGLEIPQEFQSVINDAPGAREDHSVLSQSDNTMAGRAYQQNLSDFNNQIGDKIVETLGKDPATVESMPELNSYERGRDIGETLANEIKPAVEDIGARYDAKTAEFKLSPLDSTDHQIINDQISKAVLDNGWGKSASDAEMNLANKVMAKIPEQTNIDDLKKFSTNLRDSNPFGSQTYQAAKTISNILKDNQERIISSNIIRSGGTPEEVAAKLSEYTSLKGDYAKLMNSLDNLNEHLHVGKYEGPESFLNNLKDLSVTNGEAVLNRTSGMNKANILDQLQQFPQTLEKVKQYHVDKLIDKSSVKSPEGMRVSPNALLRNIDKVSPQVKNLIIPQEKQQALEALNKIVEGLKDPHHNFSNTARTAAKLYHGVPSVFSLLAALTGHAEAGLMSFLGKLGLTEGRDALKLGMMRWLSSTQPVESQGVKAMMSYLDNAYKGNKMLSTAALNVLRPGAKVLLDSQMPSELERTKLDKLVAKSQQQPTQDTQYAQGSLGHYMPEHQTAVTNAQISQLQYLSKLKPLPNQLSPLDSPISPSQVDVARYNKALDIANNPYIVLQKVKDGTLQTSDLQDLQGMYPGVYKRMAQHLSNAMAGQQSKEAPIPYKTRMGLSLFMGQPLDNTMQPTSIMAAQQAFIKPSPQQGQPQGQPAKNKRGTSNLGKSNKSYQTQTQAAESDRGNRK